jgi:hypothetical protein
MPNLVDINGRGPDLPFPNAATSERPRLWRRTWKALKRAILGKSSRDYMKQFTGSDEYWDSAIAAHRGWPCAPSRNVCHFNSLNV